MLEFGAKVDGTNAFARMLDFDNPEGVQLLLDAGADPNEGAQQHPSGEPTYAINALHHAARRRCSGEVAQILLDYGADGKIHQFGHSAYSLARMYGNSGFAHVLEEAGQATPLDANEALIAQAAVGSARGSVDGAGLPCKFAKRSYFHRVFVCQTCERDFSRPTAAESSCVLARPLR